MVFVKPAATPRIGLSCLLLLALWSLPARSASLPLEVRGDSNYPPYEFLDHGVPAGFNVDVMRAVAGAMGLNIKIDLGPWNEVRAQLENGEIAVLTGMFRSPDRDRLVDFSTPFIQVSHAIFVRDGSPITDLNDLRGKEVLVQQGDIMDDFAKTKLPGATITRLPDQAEALSLLASGKGDAALLSKLQNQFIADKRGLKNVTTVGPPFAVMEYCFAVPEGRTELLTQLNEGLAIIRNSGEYDAIYRKWFGAYESNPWTRDVLLYAAWILGPLAVLLVISFAWSWSLKKNVEAKTRALSEELANRRRIEEELRRSEERYRDIFENVMDGYYRADMKGVLKLANPSAARMLGYENPRELVGKKIGEDLMVRPEDRAVFLDRLLTEGSGAGLQTWLKRRDGSTFLIEANARLLRDAAGIPSGVEGVFRDVTMRKRMEERLVQNEKMLSIGGLAAGMAHEINNPLGVVMAAIQNAVRRLSPDFEKNRQVAEETGVDLAALRVYLERQGVLKFLDNIQEAAARAAKIVWDMLDFSRDSESRRAPRQVNEILDKAADLAAKDYDLKKKYDFRKIDLIRDYAPDLPPAAVAETEILQVVLNLLRNAAQAMAAKSYAQERPRIAMRTAREGDAVRIEIEDNGPGFDETRRKRLFEPFFTTKPPGEGVGLGLSLSYFIIVQKHGGTFEADSAPGQGARFVIRLPLDSSRDALGPPTGDRTSD